MGSGHRRYPSDGLGGLQAQVKFALPSDQMVGAAPRRIAKRVTSQVTDALEARPS